MIHKLPKTSSDIQHFCLTERLGSKWRERESLPVIMVGADALRLQIEKDHQTQILLWPLHQTASAIPAQAAVRSWSCQMMYFT
jgi:hypothetical protein